MLEDFIWRGLLAGIGVALVAGPLGCFVVWRRMAYFGETLAHSALLGVTLGVLLGIDMTLGTALTCVIIALAILPLGAQRTLSTDTLLGIMAASSLALGLVAVSFLDTVRVDLMGYLFGDILATGPRDLVWIYGGAALVLGVLAAIWRPLLAITVHEELARAEGVPATRTRLAFTLLIALVIAITMKLVGVLLIVALLIIPPAAARQFARGPLDMAVIASGFGVLAVMGGLAASLHWDTPSGPSVVAAAALIFLLSATTGLVRRHAGR